MTRKATISKPLIASEARIDYAACASDIMQPRELATIRRAIRILHSYMRNHGANMYAPEQVRQYLQLRFAGERAEVFAVMFLDAQHRLIATEEISRGTLTQAAVYPREVVMAALRHCAASVILSHNHPSGSTVPSRADEILTQTLKSALALIDVRVLDHVVVGASSVTSMAECGLV